MRGRSVHPENHERRSHESHVQWSRRTDQNDELMDFFVSWLDEEYKGDFQKLLESGIWTEIVVDGKPLAFQSGNLVVVRTGFWVTGEF